MTRVADQYLIVVDMQNDFISGALGTDEAKAILPGVIDKVGQAIGKKRIYLTKDTHFDSYLETQEGQKLPVPHCIEGTKGWEIAGELLDLFYSRGIEPEKIIEHKNTFAAVELAKTLKFRNQRFAISEIEIIGLCTDICVISNALLLKAFLPEVKIKVDAACCAGVTPESHQNALAAMKMCHIDIV